MRHRVLMLGLLGMFLIETAWAYSDPTRPGGYQTSQTSIAKSLRLESVLIGHERKVAVISGNSYQVGDRIKGGRVESIDSHRVTIRKGERLIYLKLFDAGIKRHSGK